ncbi:MAG: hypothetical protein K0R57_1189 [Paenibacillaceae bacterium]|nr:hypothetical protein [Paenibacillaceae bacterium]
MLQKLSEKRRSVVFSWLVSYLSILLIPIIMSAIVYVQSVRIVQNQVVSINDAMIRQLQQLVDGQVQNLDKISLQIATNSKLAYLINTQAAGNPAIDFDYSERVKQLFQDFNIYTLSNTFLSDFYIYLHDSEIVITSGGFFDSREYYDLHISTERSGYEQWQSFMRQQYYNEYLISARRLANGQNGESVNLMRSLPLQGERFNSTLAISINREELNRLVSNINWADQNQFYIIDKSSNILFSSTGAPLPQSLAYGSMPGLSGVQYEVVAGEKSAVSYASSQAAEWKYFSVTPTSLFNERVEYIRKLTLVCLVLCVVIGGLIAYWLTKKNYTPLNQLIRNISLSGGFRPDKNQNEYGYLNEVIASVISDKQSTDRKLEQQYRALRSGFLARLLKGRSGQVVPADEVMKAYGISLEGPYYAVVLLNIDDYSQLMVHGSDEENLRLAHFIILNVTEELMSQGRHRGYVTEVDDLLACLLDMQGDEVTEMYGAVEKAIADIQQIMKKRFQIHLTAAVSERHQTIAGIHEAYNEAQEAMEYKLIKGRGGIIRYSEIKQVQNQPGSYNYSLETEQILTNSIKSGDCVQAEAVMNRIFEDNFAQDSISIAIAKCLMFDLVGTMIKTVNEISTVVEPTFLEKLNPVNRLLRCNTIEDMRGEMSVILSQVCMHVNERSKGMSQLKQRDMLTDFIKRHYADCSLNLNMLAEHVDLSPKYVSSFFKQLTGEGISSYINRVRLEEAKRLLQEGRLNIGEIALRVGFTNANSLIRSFNRSEGITPGQYRDMHRGRSGAGE